MSYGKQNAHTMSRKLLLVDDDAMTRDFMTTRLKRQGFTVTSAEDGPTCLRILEHDEYDLVLLDNMMPGLSGVEVLMRIREKRSMLSLPVIMVTANDLEDSLIEALNQGANDYLVKPVSMPVMLARIRSHLSLKHLSALKDEFLQFASHDLKKPLLLMLDIAEEMKRLLQGDPISATELLEPLDCMMRTGSEMQEVIQGFLNRRGNGLDYFTSKRERVNLGFIVNQAVQANAQYAQRKGVSLKAELSNESLVIRGDTFQLAQVLDNVVGNAIKFSPRNSKALVRIGLHDGFVHVEVIDTGPGIRADEMNKLFVKGSLLSNVPTGHETSSGLGLALCKQLVELHGGEIGAHNNSDHGATFWIKLPMNERESDAKPTSVPAAHAG